MARRAAVSGMFYEGGRGELVRSIEDCFLGSFGPGRLPETAAERKGQVLGLVSPHAGFVYSGSAAAWAYDALASDGVPDIAVIIGPNHHGLGAAVAVDTEPEWDTPLGTVRVDTETAEMIAKLSGYARADSFAHTREHSIEVQLPFLQFIGGGAIRIVPIAIASLSDSDAGVLVTDLGGAIVKALAGKSAVLIASTDFTHYESRASAQAKDDLALERIVALDSAGLLRVVGERSISMCGAVGTAVMLEACKALGARSARRLAYYTSGDVIGDASQVVGYGAVSVEL